MGLTTVSSRMVIGALAGLAMLSANPQTATASNGNVQCGDTIYSSIKLQTDLDCDGGTDGLIVGADNVRIDLNGHYMYQGEGGVGIRNEGFDNIKIMNGEIFADPGGPAILIHNAAQVQVIDMDAWGWVIAGLDVVDSHHVKIEGSKFGADHHGIRLLNTHNSVIRGNDISVSNPGDGLHVRGNKNRIQGNDISDAADGVGLRLEGADNMIIGNIIDGNDYDGAIVSGRGNVFRNNSVSENGHVEGAPGLLFSGEGGIVDGNVAEGNGLDGIRVLGSSTYVRNNTANHNGEWGIWAHQGVRDGGGNTAIGNGVGQCHNVLCTAD